MRKYEVMIIVDPDVDDRQVSPLIEKHAAVITKEGGTVDNTDVWGRRRFAYEINKKAEGIYAVLDLTCTPAAVQELDRQLNLNEAVLRTKVMRPDAK